VVEQEEREATGIKGLVAAGKESCEVILRFLCYFLFKRFYLCPSPGQLRKRKFTYAKDFFARRVVGLAFKRIAKDRTIVVFKYRIHDQDRCMPRRELLTAAQREAFLAFPDEEENLLRYYVLSVRDLAAVRQHRGDHNRLGFAVQLCYLRYPGRVLAENETPPAALLGMVATQLQVQPVL
jgi:hypothetical protein